MANEQIVGFSPDGKLVATFHPEDMKLRFRLPNGITLQREVPLADTPPERTKLFYAGMSRDEMFFFAIEPSGLIHVWNAQTGRRLGAFNGPPPPLRNAVLAPGGAQIAVSVERDNLVHLYDTATGAEHRLAGHTDFVSGLAFSPDAATLATGSMDGTIRLWNTRTQETTTVLPGHMQETTDLDFSPDGRTLASLGHGESVKLWHVPTGRELLSEPAPNGGMWLKFSPDGHKLAVTTDNKTVHLLEAPAE